MDKKIATVNDLKELWKKIRRAESRAVGTASASTVWDKTEAR